VDGFTIPTDFDRLTLLAALLAILGIVGVASGIVGLFRERRFRIFRIGSSVILVVAGLCVFAIAGWAQTYRALTKNELVATIHAVPVPGQPQTMQVIYTPVTGGTSGQPQSFTVSGDEWQLGGDVIKWQDWLNILGVHTGYRVTRLMGYFEDANDYRTKRVSAYNLSNSHDTVSKFLHDHTNLMPFVRATYGNDVRMLPDAAATYQIYLSTSGYWAARQ
jgi:hypothetical protein